MQRIRLLAKDYIGALLLIAIGAGALSLGMGYRMGTLNRMGAGFIPVVLGVLMIAVGIAIGVTATAETSEQRAETAEAHGHSRPEWRGWLCIIGGVVAFVVFGQYGGMVPASFASVFIAALGDRDNTVKASAALAAILTAFGVAVFHYGLSLPLPLFRWG